MKPVSKIIFGAPGSGKGTLAKLARQTGFVHIESGELLRRSRLEPDRVGRGKLASDENVLNLVGRQMSLSGIRSNFAFDGVPRSKRQARVLLEILQEHGHELVTVHVLVDEHIARHRIKERLIKEGRLDDAPKIVNERMDQFEDYGPVVIAHLRRFTQVVEIDNNGSPEHALARFASLLKARELLHSSVAQ